MVNKRQLDFKRDPKEWGNALYDQLGQVIDAINVDILPKIAALQEQITLLSNKVTLLNRNKI